MATLKTRLSELGTALGLVFDPAAPWPDALLAAELPGIDRSQWWPVIEPVATGPHTADRDLLLRALDNGRAFRQVVLRRAPRSVLWSGGGRSVWSSDIPRDLTIDDVYFVQAKYDSTCVLNTAPSNLVDELLSDDTVAHRPSWYEEVAPRELQAYYREVRLRSGLEHLPADVRLLDATHRADLKAVMRTDSAPAFASSEQAAYAELCRAVSLETALRWRHRLTHASPTLTTQLLFRMLRIAGGPYWLLGTDTATPLRLAVTDTRTWRDRFECRRLVVTAAQAGQPQVEWRAEVVERGSRQVRLVEGYCELRWSHGKLQGHPECKVQVRTPLPDLPGYDPMT